MQKFFWVVANGMAGALDLCIGIFITQVVFGIARVEIPLWYLGVGAIIGILPDLIDLPILSLWNKFFPKRQIRPEDHHVTPAHWGVVTTVLTATLTYIVAGSLWSLIVLLSLLCHYVHDSEEIGDTSMPWLAPFSWRTWTPIYPFELRRAVLWEGKHSDWLRIRWLRPSWTSTLELSLGAVLIGISVGYHFQSVVVGLIVTISPLMATLGVWFLWNRHVKGEAMK